MPELDFISLQKIGALRRRRSERKLKEAKAALIEAETARNLAAQNLEDHQKQMLAAQQHSYANPALEQAWIWQEISEQKQQEAAVHHDAMCDSEQQCESGLKQAAQALLKAQVKLDGLQNLRRMQQKAEERKAEDNLAEEIQDGSRHRPETS
ncbi:hypothetical protein [Parasphingorhabdus cellanae]|uniref:Flagellar FliJ protein n=1 Tax=Parasphingorhabdus cellanae TaxID=2806553 RepID=A0ABX7T3J1_9SPHN|nr:hypothetical protein [Parasphingorhabdus cellanae]QTD56139.1 hypothetical protein J4G78_00585 [Parasphingorhabdus cellanae]